MLGVPTPTSPRRARMEQLDLLDSIYAAEVRKLAVAIRHQERMNLSEEELAEFDKVTAINSWVLRAHKELQAVRGLLSKEAQNPTDASP